MPQRRGNAVQVKYDSNVPHALAMRSNVFGGANGELFLGSEGNKADRSQRLRGSELARQDQQRHHTGSIVVGPHVVALGVVMCPEQDDRQICSSPWNFSDKVVTGARFKLDPGLQ